MLDARIDGIVLAGTYHWRDSSFERFLPRPLVPVAQTPLICYVLRWLRDGGVTRATVCSNHGTDLVRTCLDDAFRASLSLSYYGDRTPRGAAGCARDATTRSDAETFVVADATVIPVVELEDLITDHRRHGRAVTIVVHEDQDRSPEEHRPPFAAGIYLIERRVLELVPSCGFQDIKEDLIPRLYRNGERVGLYRAPGACPRVLGPDSYLAVNRWMVSRLAAQPGLLEGYRVSGEVLAHPTAQIDRRARLVGPILIGPLVRVHEGSTIVGPATVGAECVVGPGALLSRSVTWNRCIVGGGAVLDHCILADDTVVAPERRLFNAVEGPLRMARPILGRRRSPATAGSVHPYPALTPSVRLWGGSWATGPGAFIGPASQPARGPAPV